MFIFAPLLDFSKNTLFLLTISLAPITPSLLSHSPRTPRGMVAVMGIPADELEKPHRWVQAEQCTFVNPPVVPGLRVPGGHVDPLMFFA